MGGLFFRTFRLSDFPTLHKKNASDGNRRPVLTSETTKRKTFIYTGIVNLLVECCKVLMKLNAVIARREEWQQVFFVAISTFISLNDNCSIQNESRKQLVLVIVLFG
jgi:hypothetical protein